MGLRFIKQNVPDPKIHECPLWHKYVAKLKEGRDVVGFSLFQNDIGEDLRMKELWAGGYGALDPILSSVVDRVLIGATEDDIAQVFGERVDEVMHPVMAVIIETEKYQIYAGGSRFFIWRELIKRPAAAMLYDDRKQVLLNQSGHKPVTS